MIRLALASLLAMIACAWWSGRSTASQRATTVTRALETRWAPPLLGIASALLAWCAWGSVRPRPLVHDEIAYVLQAGIFAHGRWTAPSPPVPEAFEQVHVLVRPAVAAKYPPGHALLLAPGVLAGWPPLMPLLLRGLMGALVFVLARSVAGPGVAMLTWVLWAASPGSLRWGASYFSENTTAACWLVAWWACLRWRATLERRWLLLVAATVGWGAITRPLTMLVFALPLAVVVLRTARRGRRGGDVLRAMAVGVAILAILPLWSVKTTGSWRRTPLSVYTRDYMPWDRPGFGRDTTTPARALTGDLASLGRYFAGQHEAHRADALPQTLYARTVQITRAVLGAPTRVLIPFAIVGLLVLDGAGATVVLTAVLLVLTYLSYASPPSWTLYYMELFPVLAFTTALGIAATLRTVQQRAGGDHSRHGKSLAGRERWAAVAGPLLVGALLYLPVLHRSLGVARAHRAALAGYQADFAQLLTQLPRQPAIVFVRHGPRHDPDVSLIRNSADPAAEPVWTAYDRGTTENDRLLALAPGRAAYLYDEATFTLREYDRATGAGR